MSKLKHITPALVVLLLCSMSVLPQGRASLMARSKKVEDTLKDKETEWITLHKSLGNGNIQHIWALKGTEDNLKDPNKITYYLYEFDSPTEAYELMHTIRSPIGPGHWTQEYGDETEIWDSADPHVGAKIHFRFGSEVVFIGGSPSSEIVKRFARHIADALATD